MPAKLNKKHRKSPGKILLWIAGIILILLTFFTLLMSLPGVQTYLARKASGYVKSHYGIDINIERLEWQPSGKTVITGLLVRDHHQDTLIYVHRLRTYILSYRSISDNRILLGNSLIEKSRLYMTQYRGEKTDNLNMLVTTLDSLSAGPSSGKTFLLHIRDVKLNDFKFRLRNFNIKQAPLYSISKFNGNLKSFYVRGKEVETLLRDARYRDLFGLQVRNMQLDFHYAPDAMLFQNLQWETQQSKIQGDLSLHYTREQLRHFFDEVEWSGKLKADMAGADINLIIDDSLFTPGAHIHMTTDSLQGVLNEWELNHSRVSAGPGINYAGDMIVFNLTTPDSLGVQLLADNLNIGYSPLKKLLPGIVKKHIPPFLRNAGNMQANGNLVYFPGRIETDMHIRSDAGYLQPRLFIHFGQDDSYRGTLQTDSLDLGKLFDLKNLGAIRGKIQIDGHGFNKQTAAANLYGKIKRLTYRHYAYRNLAVHGQLRQGKFNGKLRVNDPHFKMDFLGLIHFGQYANIFDFTASLTDADLYRTHWIKKDTLARLSGKTNMRFRGKTLDDVKGTWHLENVHYVNSYNSYHLGFMDIHARDTAGNRRIDIHSDKAVNGYLEGRFHINQTGKLIRYAIGTLLPRYKTGKPLKDFLRFNLLFDGNLLELLDPQLEQVRQTRIKGKINGNEKYVHVVANTDLIQYGGTRIRGANLILDNQNAIYNLYARSDSVIVGNYSITNFRTIHLNIKDTVYVKSKFYGGPGTRDTFDLAFYYANNKTLNRWTARLLPSQIKFNNRLWNTSDDPQTNNIYYFPKKDSIFINRLTLTSDPAYIQANGFDAPGKRNITVDVRNFNMHDLQQLISPATWSGNVNGQIFMGKNKKTSFYNGQFSIAGFRFNQVPLGVVHGDFRTLRNSVMFVNLYNRLDDMENFRTTGFLDFSSNEMDLNIRSNHLPVNVLETFLEGIFDNMRGTASGHVQMTGKFDNPFFMGRLNLFKAGLRVVELNTDYQFADNSAIDIDKDKFLFNQVHFSDVKYGTQGLLNGQIGFYQFSDWTFDLHLSGDKLLALDTPGTDEDLYYGTAFVKGNADITGDLNKIKINAQLQSREGTKIHIPLRDVETVGEDDFINYYHTSEYKQHDTIQKRRTQYYEGLELNLNLDVTRDAVIDITLDQEFGSHLTARGQGVMLMEINTAGKFNMWGTYQVAEGYYDFRYLGIIDKRFEVDDGSTLSWNGDPYHALLNIRAVYHIPAVDITPLLKDAVALQQKVPVDVVINLSGDLMKPRIDFQIELPQANGVIRSQAEYVLSDPDKRMLQVLSLLYSSNFISEDILKLNSLSAAEGNLSERVLSVFNSLLQNEAFDVKLNYVPGGQNPETNVKTDSQVGLTVQTKVNKRIYINGKVVMPVGRYTSSSVSGDIEAVLWLNPDGTWQIHVYNKRTPIEYAGQEEGYTQGVGLRFNTDFDTFRELAAKFGFNLKTGEELKK